MTIEVIFLKDVPNVGQRGQVKRVSDGYAHNFLFPRGLAAAATPERLRAKEQAVQRKQVERQERTDEQERLARRLQGLRLQYSGKVSPGGKLFSALHPEQVSELLRQQCKLSVPPEQIELTEPLKDLGEHQVRIRVQPKLVVPVIVAIKPLL